MDSKGGFPPSRATNFTYGRKKVSYIFHRHYIARFALPIALNRGYSYEDWKEDIALGRYNDMKDLLSQHRHGGTNTQSFFTTIQV